MTVSATTTRRCGRMLSGIVAAVLILAATGSDARAEQRSPGRVVAPVRPPGYLGIGFRNLESSQVVALRLRQPAAVEVQMVDHDGPAGQAGLEPHDIILTANGLQILSADALSRILHDTPAGSAVTLLVLRQGRTLQLTAVLATREEVERRAQDNRPPVTQGFMSGPTVPAVPQPSRTQQFFNTLTLRTPWITGLGLTEMSPQLAFYFGAPQGVGLLVEQVDPQSPAAQVGIRAGDIVLSADAAPLGSVSEWTKRLRNNKGQPISLVILRDHREQAITLVPETKHR